MKHTILLLLTLLFYTSLYGQDLIEPEGSTSKDKSVSFIAYLEGTAIYALHDDISVIITPKFELLLSDNFSLGAGLNYFIPLSGFEHSDIHEQSPLFSFEFTYITLYNSFYDNNKKVSISLGALLIPMDFIVIFPMPYLDLSYRYQPKMRGSFFKGGITFYLVIPTLHLGYGYAF